MIDLVIEGYPTEQTMQPGAKAVRPQTQARGEKGFIEGW
jgi:hypothetical protein